MSSRLWFRIAAIALLVFAVALAAAIAFGTAQPPAPVRARHLDLTGLPPLSRYAARDGAKLVDRVYPGNAGTIAVILHGTTTESSVVNAPAKALQSVGATVYAPDLRGHGSSGRRGDIDYIGQLDDDLADLVAAIRKDHPHARMTLVGFSGGGAFALRIAGGRYGGLFDRYILIDPAIVYPSPIARPDSGGWARPYFPRIVGLAIVNAFGIHAFDGLDTIAFAAPLGRANLTKIYSYRLMMNLNSAGYLDELRNTKKPMALIAGAADDQFYAERYGPIMKPAKPDLSVTLVPGMDHVDMLMKPPALSALTQTFETLPYPSR